MTMGRGIGLTLCSLGWVVWVMGEGAPSAPTDPSTVDSRKIDLPKIDLRKIDRQDDVIRGLPISKAPVPRATEFVIASYNVQTRPFLDRPKDKLPLISERLGIYDVVLIQECFTRHDLLWARADFPNKTYFGRLAGSDRLTNSGLSILSRLPMGETIGEHFRVNGELQNRAASKGMLLARLQAGGISIDVCDTHMEAGDSSAAQQARRKQALQVVEFVTRHSPREHALILMGDFNMGPARPGLSLREFGHYSSEEDRKERTATFELMRSSLGLRDAADEVLGKRDHGIERLLFRDGENAHLTPLAVHVEHKRFCRDDGSPLSDGSPLVVRMKVTP